MPAPGTTSRLITAYAESEPWEEHHDRAMVCHGIEEVMTWGLHLFRGLFDLEAALQRRALGGVDVPEESDWKAFERDYRMLVGTSERVLRLAEDYAQTGFLVNNLDEFRQIVEEARCQIELWDLEPELRPIDETVCLTRPENPRPNRYGS